MTTVLLEEAIPVTICSAFALTQQGQQVCS